MVNAGLLVELFRPTKKRVLLAAVLLVLVLVSFFFGIDLFGYDDPIIYIGLGILGPFLLLVSSLAGFADNNVFVYDIVFILIIPLIIPVALAYIYVLSCLLLRFFAYARTRKWLFVPLLVLFLLFSGIDEPIVNNTINKPDFTCTVDSDCVEKKVRDSECGGSRCVNKEWGYYDSLLADAYALTCSPNLIVDCTCTQNRCEAVTISYDEYSEEQKQQFIDSLNRT